ncbi:hypothetical protein Q4511_13640 [Paracoccus sp. 1_MG-2023]|nr:hypothetical protein [Paracoccus sp. 1_MG-2023]MDO6669970.1 hypothetical protein [Paracoccus sp. 1_MG-2023]
MAFAMSCGMAGAASAATVVDIDLKLRYDGTFYHDGVIIPNDDDAGMPLNVVEFTKLRADGGVLGLPHWDMEIGEETFFKAQLVLPEPGTEPASIGYRTDNGGRAPSCQLGYLTCGDVTEVYNSGDRWHVFWDDQEGLSFDLLAGGKLSYQYTPEFSASSLYFDWGWLYFDDRFAEFTVLEVLQPAPVPVPMSAAFLPVAFGALASLRRRRSRIS